MSGNRRHGSRLAALCAIALLAGCASLGPELPMATTPDESEPVDVPLGIRTLDADHEFVLRSSASVARELEASPGERPLSILALSSGGSSGAFGAGALVGSVSRGRQTEFTVVTGVSAGAMLAPFAFLGADWKARLTTIFTTGATDELLQRRLFGGLFGSSVYSGEPLRRLIERYADDDMVAAVAAQAAKGRLLLVATTDLATGEPVIWDLGSVALHGGRDAKPLFQTLLLASASIPGMLPPVVVKFRSRGRVHVETHVDGGVTLPFFIAPAVADLPQFIPGTPHPPTVRVIIDGPLRDVPRPTHANAFSIFSRSLSDGLSHVTRAKLEATVESARRHGIAFAYAAIPASHGLPGAFDFDADAQRALFKYAAACAVGDRLWISVPSAGGAAGTERTSVSTPACPADDSFIGRFAAVSD